MASGGLSQWDGSDKIEIASPIRQVESYFVVKEIEDEQKKVALLHLSLKGEPKTFFSRLSQAQTDSFAHAKAALEERFKPFKTKAQYQQELAERRQHPGETVIELKFAIIELVSKAYPEVTESVAKNAMVVAHVRKALRQDIRQKLTQVEREAGSVGINAIPSSNAGSSEPQLQGKPASNETSQDRLWQALSELAVGQQQLTQTIAAMQAQPRRPDGGSRRQSGNCYNCGAPGHLARNCRKNSPAQRQNQGMHVNGVCFHCKNWGHKADFCPVRKDRYPGNDSGLGGLANTSQPRHT